MRIGAPAPSAAPSRRSRISPATLALRAWQELYLPAPAVDTAPPRGSDGWVGLPEYFWLAPGQWLPRSARVQAGAEWAQIVANPVLMTVTLGPGFPPIVCGGPGIPYQQASAASATAACTHEYRMSSLFQPTVDHLRHAYAVTVIVTWTGTWQGAGGVGGTLPEVSRSTTFGLRIGEAQALVRAR